LKASIPLRDNRYAQRAAKEIDRALGEEVLHEVLIRPFRKNRTIEQNALYHSILKDIAEQTGNTHGALHEFFKMEFLGIQTFTVNDKIMSRPRSTTGLTTKEFGSYIEQLHAWCADQGIKLEEVNI